MKEPDDIEKRKDSTGFKVKMSSQSISDFASLSMAIAIGLFGILALYVMIDQPGDHSGFYGWIDLGQWKLICKIVFAVAYFALVLVGAICIVGHQFHASLQEKYLTNVYKDYLEDLKEVSTQNWFFKIFVYHFWLKWLGRNASVSALGLILVPYLGISIALWFFVAFL